MMQKFIIKDRQSGHLLDRDLKEVTDPNFAFAFTRRQANGHAVTLYGSDWRDRCEFVPASEAQAERSIRVMGGRTVTRKKRRHLRALNDNATKRRVVTDNLLAVMHAGRNNPDLLVQTVRAFDQYIRTLKTDYYTAVKDPPSGPAQAARGRIIDLIAWREAQQERFPIKHSKKLIMESIKGL